MLAINGGVRKNLYEGISPNSTKWNINLKIQMELSGYVSVTALVKLIRCRRPETKTKRRKIEVR